MPETHHPNRRKKWIIYPQFQVRLIIFNNLVMLALFGLLALQEVVAVSYLRSKGREAHLAPGHAYFVLIDKHATVFYFGLVVTFLLGVATLSIASVLMSQRLAGPIVRLFGYFKRISEEGENAADKLSFRKGDFFLELPPIINDAVQRLRGRDKNHSQQSSDTQKIA